MLLHATVTASAAQSGSSAAEASVFTREVDGRIVVRATRTTQPIRIDGRLDERVYTEVPPLTEFVQAEPNEGAPVTEKTEAWVLFDDRNIYISFRCWDEHPERIVANEMRRDSGNQNQHDNVAVAFDTFYDGRNGFQFNLSAAGGMRDGAVADERFLADWNGVYDTKAIRDDKGWIGEMAIPFKTLRYPPGRQQIWHVQLRRLIRSKNEFVYITPLKAGWGLSAINKLALAATLIGLEAPPPGLNLEIKPYAITPLTTDLVAVPAVRNKFKPDAGVDVKYGITKGLTADFTYNTDFAQVEADEAQINLSRFNLAFPEKREFFLEGQGIFDFGLGGSSNVPSVNAPTIFYSRRIGLSGSRAVPVIAGARMSGRAGPWSVGAFNMETDADTAARAEQTNFTVLRLRRNILRRSNVGGIYTRRSESTVGPGANDVWGLDANFVLYTNVYFSGYVSRSRTPTRDGDDLSYRGQFYYNSDRYGLAFDHNVVEENFNPEVGFLRRLDFKRSFGEVRFSPRTTRNRIVRKLFYRAGFDYTTDNHNILESREAQGSFRTEFHNGDAVAVEHSRFFEFLPESFLISQSVRIPVGGYNFENTIVSYLAGAQRRVSGTSSIEVGSFYDGHKKTAEYRGRIDFTGQLGFEPTISLNWIDLPQGRFRTTIIGGRGVITLTPRMFATALIQRNSSNNSLSTNLRFRWEYHPGSELFVVYSEGRSTLPPTRGEPLQNRGIVVKINRLFRF